MFFMVRLTHKGVHSPRIGMVTFLAEAESGSLLQEQLRRHLGLSCAQTPWAPDDKAVCDGKHEADVMAVTSDNTVQL